MGGALVRNLKWTQEEGDRMEEKSKIIAFLCNW